MNNLLVKNTLALRAVSFSVLLSIVFSLLLPSAANAQITEPPPPSRQLVMKEKTSAAELPRLALVIGNADYRNITKLKNSSADAADMTVALKALGFEVISGINQSKKQMEGLIREFGDKLLRQKGIGLFFYAGHGVQSNSRNYLIPVDADIPREDEIADSAIDINRILGKFNTAGSDLNIVILDACRNNPFAKDWSEFRAVSGDEGLAKINAPKGTVLLYSTEPGKTASDGAGRNGLFTEVLLENIKKPNVELDNLYKIVARSVAEKSKQLQRPYKEGTNFSDFYFAGETATKPVPPSPIVKSAVEAEPEITEKDAATRERDSWNLVKSSADAADFRYFLEEFPNGTNAAKAKIRLEQIFWDAIKTTKDKTLVQNHLKEFPNGANASTARIKLKQLEARENVEPMKTETMKPESVKTEAAEVKTAEPVELPAKKPETPKATRTVKAKVKPSAAGAGNFAVRTNAAGMEFVQLPAGNFMMGSSEANVNESYALGRKDYKETVRDWFDNEKTQHRVTFNDGFWIGKTEVTQAQWTAVIGENPSFFKNCDDCPVERVSWEDAKKFVEKLNETNDGFDYRLPTEAEWEYAARGGKTGILAGRMEDMAWYHINSENKTHPVGTRQPNAFGLYDMHGNVAEWCEDLYSINYEGAPADGTANLTGDAEHRVLRGGYWNDFPTNMRLPRRDPDTPPKVRRSSNGLRVVAVEKR